MVLMSPTTDPALPISGLFTLKNFGRKFNEDPFLAWGLTTVVCETTRFRGSILVLCVSDGGKPEDSSRWVSGAGETVGVVSGQPIGAGPFLRASAEVVGLLLLSIMPSRSSMNIDTLGDVIPFIDGVTVRFWPLVANPRLSDTTTGELMLFLIILSNFGNGLPERGGCATSGEGSGFINASFVKGIAGSESSDTLLNRTRS